MVFILNKQEKVINILKNNGGANGAPPFFDDVYTQDLATGAETFSFSTVAVGDIARDLVVGNYVAFRDENKQYKLFQIVQTEESHEDTMYITVYAEGAGLELINKVFRARKSPSTSLRKFMEMVLDETGWNVGAIPLSAQESLDLDLEDATAYATLQNTLSKYGVEMAFRCEINNGRISSKFVDLYTQRGKVTGKRFTFGRDIEGIRRKVDSTELFTALIGKGNKDISFKDVTVDGINKPLGQDFVADQEAYDRYNNNGYHIIGIFNYDTESPEELLRETYKQLQKCKEPKIEYEVSVALLGELLGESWNKVSIGDTVAIVDNAFNPPIHLMARVSKLDKSFTNSQSDTCTLANFVEVKSNITDEMRKIASKLEGYVDAQFPIGGDKIQDGAIGQDQMNQQYMSQVSADIVKASVVEAEKVIADEIEAVNGRFESIEAEHGSFKDITTNRIDAVEGTFVELEAEVGRINTLVSGNITSDNIHSSGISSDKLTIKDGFIKNAMIDTVNASKINAGEINTNKVHITSANGGIVIADNTQQFKDKNGKVRVQIGQDAKGDFNFGVFDETGTGVLIDATGVKEQALADGIIKDRMIDQGEIDGSKIDISSLVTEVNKDTNTTAIKGSKILLDTTRQTLDVAFNSLKSSVDYSTERIEANTTELGVQAGKISTLIKDTTIEKNGQNLKLKDEYSKLEQTVGGIKTTIGTHESTITDIGKKVSTNTSSIEQLNNKIELKVEQTDVETTVNSAITSSTNAIKEQLKKDIATEISNVNNTIANLSNYVDGVFKDNVIDEAEKENLRLQLKKLEQEKAEIDARYTQIYNNNYLT